MFWVLESDILKCSSGGEVSRSGNAWQDYHDDQYFARVIRRYHLSIVAIDVESNSGTVHHEQVMYYQVTTILPR